ncbi:CHAT domain-containing protein [Isoptericola jiangsuensis]|uniref:CHAT domain-containing protein n=1 Tax=Isoptericola jiangsuensis TaxID=548579 RepID=UPI003AB07CCA
MNRVVFQISALGRSAVPLVSLVEPTDPKTYHEEFTCPAVAMAAPASDAEADYGGRLYDALSVNTVLRDHLIGARTSRDERFGVCAEILPQSKTDALAWETLRFPDEDGQQYLALSTKYAFARVVAAGQPRVPVYQLAPPVRVVAVLSCLGVAAEQEIAELRRAAMPPDAAHGPRMSILFVLGEADLAVGLEAERTAGTAPEIAGVHLVPTDFHVLRQLVRDFRPHVLHLFAHGSPDGTVRLALRTDWGAATPGPGLALDKEQVAELTRNTDGGFWLVVLNCCASAAVDEEAGLTSLARELVSKGSAHAVVGMRAPIRSLLAQNVTKSLYGTLLDDLGARIDAPSPTATPVDWAVLVATARQRLATARELNDGPAPGPEREWTVPALYLRKDEFQLQIVDDGPEVADHRLERLELTALMSVRTSLPPDTGASFRAAVEARITEIAPGLGLAPDSLEEEP